MIKEAIEKLLELAPYQSIEIDGQPYCKTIDPIIRVKAPADYHPKPLSFFTLTGLVEYIRVNPDGLVLDDCILHVCDHNKAQLVGPLLANNDNQRFAYAVATVERKQFPFGAWMDLEKFIIHLQADMAPDMPESDVDKIIELVGSVANEHIKTNVDNGFSQTVEVKTGLTLNQSVKVQNPVLVYPYRTFIELQQPGSKAIIRFRKGGEGLPQVALFDCGGGGWRVEAIHRITFYLIDNLPKMRVLA